MKAVSVFSASVTSSDLFSTSDIVCAGVLLAVTALVECWGKQRAVGTPAESWCLWGKGWRCEQAEIYAGQHEQMEGKHCVYLDFIVTWSSFGSEFISRDASCHLGSFSGLYLLQRNCCGPGKSWHCGVFPSHPQLVLATLATASMDLDSLGGC